MGSGVRDCCILHGLWSQRLLHPPWALESETATSSMGSRVRDCYILHELWSQRLLHPPWALESETAASSMGSGVRDCCILHGLWSQRLLHPPWALESASHMGGEVSSSIFATLGLSSAEGELLLCSTAGCVCLLLPLSSSVWGRYQVKESCHFAPPHSVSVFIFVCLHLHLPASSSTYIIIHPPTLLTAHVIIFLHLCPSLW